MAGSKDILDIMRALEEAEVADREALVKEYEQRSQKLRDERDRLIDEAIPLQNTIVSLEGQLKSARNQYERRVGYRLTNVNYELSRLQADFDGRLQSNAATRRVMKTRAVERAVDFREAAQDAMPKILDKARILSSSKDSFKQALGTVVGAALENPTIKGQMPLIVEKGLSSFGERNNRERVFVGEYPRGARLIFLQDGNFAIVHHLGGMPESAQDLFGEMGDPNMQHHVHMIGFVTAGGEDGGSDFLNPFVLLKAGGTMVPRIVDSLSPGLLDIKQGIAEALNTGKVSFGGKRPVQNQ